MKIVRLLTAFFFLSVFAYLPAYAQFAQKETYFSSDEMLTYTLTELKNRLQDVVGENTKLSNRNNALRKRMLSLRQDMRQMENHKLSLLERKNDLSDFIKIDADEHSLMERKMAEMDQESSFSDEVSTTLSKTAEQNKERNDKLHKAIAKIQSELSEIKQSHPRKPALPTRSNEEEKDSLLSRIQEAGANNRSLERKIPELKKKMALVEKKKSDLAVRNTSLKADVEAAKANLQVAISEQENISKNQSQNTKVKDQATENLKAEVEHLNSTYENMSNVIESYRQARQKMDADIMAQKRDSAVLTNLLVQESDLLKKRRDLLSEQLRLKGVGEDGNKIDYTEKIAALSKDLEPLRTENAELKNKVLEQTRQQQTFNNQAGALKSEIAQLKLDLKKTQNQGQQSKENALKERKAHLVKLLNTYQSKNEALKKQALSHRAQSQQARQKVETWSSRDKERELALKTMEDELNKAKDEEGVIRDQAKSLESQQGQGAEKLKQEIETLDLRKTVLMSSVEAIKSKYDQDKDTIREFLHGNQKELEDYLTVLQNENVALRDKAYALGETIKTLQKQ